MIYYIADMHFGHENVIHFDDRPFAHTEQMDEEQLAVAGIPAGMVRISVGLESKDDLIADLAQALSGIEA